MTRFLNVFNKILALLLLVAAATVLVVSTLTTIYYDMHVDVDLPVYGKENIPLLALFLVLVFAGLFLTWRSGKFENCKVFIIAGLVFTVAYCLLLILSIKPQAVNDSKMLDDIINQFSEGDFSSLTTRGGYLFVWPFQLGYVGFGQLMVRFFGKSNYFAWDIAQLISIVITLLAIYGITWEIFEDRKVCGIVGILSMGALFFYNYVTYIYGDILSMAPQTIALYMMVLFVKRDKVIYAVISAIAIAAAIILKTNCEITLIALILVLLGSAFDKPEKGKLAKHIILAAVFLILTFASKALVDSYYCKLTGLEKIPDGSPAWSHIAMGLQESELEDGWYNGYNYQVFGENDYDSEKTARAAKENIKETLSGFAKDPKRGVKFFVRKFTTQWADSVCISTHNLDLVSRHVENQPKLCDFLVFGTGSKILIWIMNIFMPVCYIGATIYLLSVIFRRRASAAEMLLLILIFGGIVFHEFWEGSSRYAMRYYIYWLPYAAYGINALFAWITRKPERKR